MPHRLKSLYLAAFLFAALSGCRAGLFSGAEAPAEAPPEAAIIAHRGASYDAPENTLASVELGWQRGADGVEVDVHLSRDDRVVVIHDKTTKRTAGEGGRVREQTLSELKALDVGSWKGRQWAGERIPTLAEVLETVPEGRQLYVEIKTGKEILMPLRQVLRQSDVPPKQVVLIGFGRATMAAAKKLLPEHTVLWLSGMQRENGRWVPSADELIRKAKEAQVDGLDVQATEGLDRAFAEQVEAAGLSLYVWTVNDPAVARRMERIGVEGITTDRPGWMRRQLSSAAAAADGR